MWILFFHHYHYNMCNVIEQRRISFSGFTWWLSTNQKAIGIGDDLKVCVLIKYTLKKKDPKKLNERVDCQCYLCQSMWERMRVPSWTCLSLRHRRTWWTCLSSRHRPPGWTHLRRAVWTCLRRQRPIGKKTLVNTPNTNVMHHGINVSICI